MWNQQNCWTLQTRSLSGINRLCDQKEALYCRHKRNDISVQNFRQSSSANTTRRTSLSLSSKLAEHRLPGFCGLFFFQSVVYLRNIFRSFSSINGIVCITMYFFSVETIWIWLYSVTAAMLLLYLCLQLLYFFSWRSDPRALRVQPQMLKLDLRTLNVLSLLLKSVWAGV